MSSIFWGSMPITKGRQNSSTAVTTAAARWVNVAQPSPYSPGSLVSTLTTISCWRPWGAVLMTLTFVICRGMASPKAGWSGAVYPGRSPPASRRERVDLLGGVQDADLEVVALALARRELAQLAALADRRAPVAAAVRRLHAHHVGALAHLLPLPHPGQLFRPVLDVEAERKAAVD